MIEIVYFQNETIRTPKTVLEKRNIRKEFFDQIEAITMSIDRLQDSLRVQTLNISKQLHKAKDAITLGAKHED